MFLKILASTYLAHFSDKLPQELKEIFVKAESSNLFIKILKEHFLQNAYYTLQEVLNL